MSPRSLDSPTIVLARLPATAAALAGLAGLAALLGWALGLPPLRSLLPGAVAMNPMTAVAVLLLAVALVAFARGNEPGAGPAWRTAGRVAAGLAALVAGLKLVALLTGAPLAVDTLLFPGRIDAETPANRMATTTATAILLVAAAAFLSTGRDRAMRLVPWLLLPGAVLSGLALLGYLYGVPRLYGPTRSIPMAFPTAATLLALSVGTLALRPDRGIPAFLRRDDAGGRMARNLLPAVLLAPVLFGALRIGGESAGWFDRPVGAALSAIAQVSLLALVVGITAQAASRMDAERVRANAALQATLRSLDERVAERTEAARRSEERYRRLVEASPDTLFVQQGGRIIYINPAGIALFGARDESELLGGSVFDRIHPDSHALVRARLDEIQAGRAVPLVEEKFVRLDGSVVAVEVVATPLGNAGEEGVQVIARDTTQRAHLESQLRQAQKMEAVGRLAGGIAHDFNNLLMPILGYSEMIAAEAGAGRGATQYAKEIERAARRATELTRQLLSFSRQRVSDPRVLDLNEVLADVESMLRRLLGTEIELAAVQGSRTGRVLADPGQVEQVLVNLTINARDAMPGGGRLTIETADVELDEAGAAMHPGLRPGAYVLLAVSDEGEGMSEEVKARIFDPFFTTKPQGHGTGLGLSTVHGIVEQTGGQIEVYSEPGHGTTFKIYLPQTERAEPAPAPAPAEAAPAAAADGEVVLVVDDVELVRHVTRRMLETAGHLVLEAASAADALRVFQEAEPRPRAVITDVAMPGMRGPELARELLRLDPGLAILLVSGYSDAAMARREDLEGVAGFLEKPFNTETLLRLLRAALDGTPDQPPR